MTGKSLWRNFGLAGVTVVLVLTTVLGVATGVGYSAAWRDDEATEKARSEALGKAKEYAKDILSYDYRALEADLAKAKEHMTPEMASQYDSYYRKTVFPLAPRVKAVMRTDVQASGIVQSKPDRVEVLLFVNSLSVTARSKEPRLDLNRTLFVMEKTGDRWLVAKAGFGSGGSSGPPVAPSAEPTAKPTAKPSSKSPKD